MSTKSNRKVFFYRVGAALAIVLLALAALPVSPAYAAACTFTSNAKATGNWSDPSSWTATGTNCGSYPGAGFIGDTVVFPQGGTANTMTLDVSPANPIASISFQQGANQNVTLSFNPDTTLVVTGDVTLPRAQSGKVNRIAVGAGRLNIQGNLAPVTP